MQSSDLKQKAINLRNAGFSYNLISAELGINKSTLSGWLKDVPFTPNSFVLERIKNGPFVSGKKHHERKLASIFQVKRHANKELGELSKRDLWMLGIGLYLGEGSKLYETTRIINSDPEIIKLALRWFWDICGLSTENISIAIHLYPDNDIQECLNYWGVELGIPLSCFGKTQVDMRSNKSLKKKRKLPYGTAHITIKANGNPQHGVLLHRRIMGWIEAVLKQIENSASIV